MVHIKALVLGAKSVVGPEQAPFKEEKKHKSKKEVGKRKNLPTFLIINAFWLFREWTHSIPFCRDYSHQMNPTSTLICADSTYI